MARRFYAELSAHGKTVIEVDGENIELDGEDVEVRLQANEGWAAAQGPNAVVVLSTELTPELIRLGKARDVVRLVQDRRKEMDLQFTDRIDLWLVTESEELRAAIDENRDYIMNETLVDQLESATSGRRHRVGGKRSGR